MRSYFTKNFNDKPQINLLNWIMGTVCYTLVMFINHNFELIHALGFSSKTESIIKLTGVLGYMLFTAFNFQKNEPNASN